ncbi:sigma-54 dependent transcriptional regulator [Accumulibacter sp.]|uniref:sigma-54-dependent transcriptional regulator n=2 Tax=Accumulibacter sp. TaxID=2053492 RepID=UPI002B7EF45A|nr:sigma-54 dependent transcriptional regulator [Accumulibacter sp.]HNE38898.1 sigma-54 dependent transcriptional regulator [Accumulibacter sp.]
MPAILIIDDEETFVKNAARFLAKSGHEVSTALTASAGLELFGATAPDAVILDYRLPDMDGVSLIQRLRTHDQAVPIVMITGHGSIELAVDAMKAGANDLLTKPVALSDLRQRLENLTRRQLDSSRLRYFEAREHDARQQILGESPAIVALRTRIARIAEAQGAHSLPPVLITGETGTGKELVARAFHYDGARCSRPFIELNCAAIPATLLEAELFGHERGAFTDAKERRIGLLEAADGGTLFLDEVAEMDLALQAKLLKVIEDGRFRRIGSVHERQADLRIVAATHQDLEERIGQGAFRADLYFRLRVLQVNVPPLRERAGDALLLAGRFLDEFAHRYRRVSLRFSAQAARAITEHHWPGNVRELRNVVEQAVLLSTDSEIGLQDLCLPARRTTGEATAGTMPTAAREAADGSTLDRLEREALIGALTDAGHNVSQAARTLGISRDTLRYRMEKHRLRQRSPG